MTNTLSLPARKTSDKSIRAREGKKLLKEMAVSLRQVATAIDRYAKQNDAELLLELDSMTKLNKLCQAVLFDILDAMEKEQRSPK